MSDETPATPVIDPTDDNTHEVERRVKVRLVPVSEVQAERVKRQELERKLAELEALKPLADNWQAHVEAETRRITEANAADLAALPEAARGHIASITDPRAQRAILDAIKATAAANAATATTEAAPAQAAAEVAFPGGAAAAKGAALDTLTDAERAWKSSQPTLSNASDATIRALYARLKRTPGR